MCAQREEAVVDDWLDATTDETRVWWRQRTTWRRDLCLCAPTIAPPHTDTRDTTPRYRPQSQSSLSASWRTLRLARGWPVNTQQPDNVTRSIYTHSDVPQGPVDWRTRRCWWCCLAWWAPAMACWSGPVARVRLVCTTTIVVLSLPLLSFFLPLRWFCWLLRLRCLPIQQLLIPHIKNNIIQLFIKHTYSIKNTSY